MFFFALLDVREVFLTLQILTKEDQQTAGLKKAFAQYSQSVSWFPIAEHFNSDAHSLDDIMVCGLKQSSGSNTRRKQQEMRLIFELGMLRPSALNINFNFL